MDEFEQDWEKYDAAKAAGGWEKVGFTSGWGAGFKRGLERNQTAELAELRTLHSSLVEGARKLVKGWREDDASTDEPFLGAEFRRCADELSELLATQKGNENAR